MNKHTPKPWLWPDRTIGKRESRILREEHNEAINQRGELLVALQTLKRVIEDIPLPETYHMPKAGILAVADAAIHKATQA